MAVFNLHLLYLLGFLTSFTTVLNAKVASLDVCADQWVLLTIKPEYIGALSSLSRNPTYSHWPHHQITAPTYNGNPDLLPQLAITHAIADGYLHPFKKTLLKKMKIQVLILPPLRRPEDFQKRLAFLKSHLPPLYFNPATPIDFGEPARSIPETSALLITAGDRLVGRNSQAGLVLDQLHLKNKQPHQTDRPLDLESCLAANPDIVLISQSHPKKKRIQTILQARGLKSCLIPERFLLCPVPLTPAQMTTLLAPCFPQESHS